MTNGNGTAVGEAQSNDAAYDIETTIPYIATVTVEGTSSILFHRWSNEAVAEKAKAAKNSAAKKTDNVESYVYRCEDGTIGLPGMYLRGAVIEAGRYRQDPRSPRKSMMDMLKAAIVPLTEVGSLGKAEWDYLDEQRVTVQRNGVTRVRPAFLAGWRATIDLLCNLPEYVPPAVLLSLLNDAGRIIGVADFRPTYGRFQVVQFDVNVGLGE